ncbi:hypothetical protein ABB28_05765 [Stenotrophomonas chelatiphaga]|uniref:Uncharacterized protein n=1 Tax=Stenotrophomonas chelatiphaga TaxID=517011 RepID=A0A0R0DA73_9GAMM|nr:DUF480 domain-containing protein [Stenotrophomonas chelatiphaga]KRG75031.1 hypothetical protein ABB28_05765 [Stenotrophomonas chelatiphaga]
MTDTPDTPARPLLDATQARLLGCLVEKEATTPDTYPLTVNAAQSAANQKTARDPLMNLDAGNVQHALRQLETMGLARQHFSSRADRYEHRLQAALDLTRQQTVVLALLLLRGPQTLAELVTRAERLHRFGDADEARHAIERLQQRELLVVLPRASGQREDRYMHLLCGDVDGAALAAAFASSGAAPAGAASHDPALAERVAQLETAVAELRAELDALRG